MNDLFTEEQLAEMRKETGREDFGKEEFHTIEKIYEIVPAVKIKGMYTVLRTIRLFRVKATQLLSVQFQRGHVTWVIFGENAKESIVLSAGSTQQSGLGRKMDVAFLDELLNNFQRHDSI